MKHCKMYAPSRLFALFLFLNSVSAETLLVKYNNDEGRNFAVNIASRIVYDFVGFDIIAVEVAHQTTAMSLFRADENIESADSDWEMHAIDPVPDFRQDKRRQLEELVPWGIDRVQAPLVHAGPDAGDIKVCVVDTGYGLGHPDLPVELTVTGTDNPEYPGATWHRDVYGHVSTS